MDSAEELTPHATLSITWHMGWNAYTENKSLENLSWLLHNHQDAMIVHLKFQLYIASQILNQMPHFISLFCAAMCYVNHKTCSEHILRNVSFIDTSDGP